jgi:hypothetical protein
MDLIDLTGNVPRHLEVRSVGLIHVVSDLHPQAESLVDLAVVDAGAADLCDHGDLRFGDCPT